MFLRGSAVIWVLLIVVVVLAAGVASGLYTGGWRRVLVRVGWRSIARRVGAANRKERVVTTKKGPGEKASMTQAVEHLPILWGALGRPIGPYSARVGARWRVWAADGTTISELGTKTAEIAATSWCVRCIVEPRQLRNGGTSLRAGTMSLLWRDPFRETRAWHPAVHGRIRPAFDVQGRPVDVPLMSPWGGSWLIGAASGSGKSGWMNAIVAQLAQQDPGTIGLLGVDLKRVELGPWSPAFHDVARTTAEADRMLRFVRSFIRQRMADLEQAGLRHVPDEPTEQWPYLAFVIEELGAWLVGLRGQAADETRSMLGEVAMLQRAAGVVTVAAIQRPTTDVIPGQFRDNTPRRVLLRVPTIKAGEAVLGWTPTQAVIDQLDITGLALVDLPGRTPFLARSTWGELDDVHRITAPKEPAAA